MSDPPKDQPSSAVLKVKYTSATVDEFIQQTSKDISLLGVFIESKTPQKEGVALNLELQLEDGSPVLRGTGQVVWRREISQSDNRASGMGVKFLKLDAASRKIVDRAVKVRGLVPSRFDRLGEAAARESRERVSNRPAVTASSKGPQPVPKSDTPAPQVPEANATAVPTSTLIESPPPPPQQQRSSFLPKPPEPVVQSPKEVSARLSEPVAQTELAARAALTDPRQPATQIRSRAPVATFRLPAPQSYLSRKAIGLPQTSKQEPSQPVERPTESAGIAEQTPPPSLSSTSFSDIAPRPNKAIDQALAKNWQERCASMAELTEGPSRTPSLDGRQLEPFALESGPGAGIAPSFLDRMTLNPGKIRPLIHLRVFGLALIGSTLASSKAWGVRLWAHRRQGVTTRSTKTKLWFAIRLIGVAAGAVVVVAAVAVVVALMHPYRSTDATSTYALPRAQSAHNGPLFKSTVAGRVPVAQPSEGGSLTAQISAVSVFKGRVDTEPNADAMHTIPPSEEDSLSKPNTRRESRGLVSPAIAKRERAAAKTRAVTLYNKVRVNVKVTLRCGSASVNVNVSPLGQVSPLVPLQSCRVTCAGAGKPICPTILGADAFSLEIR